MSRLNLIVVLMVAFLLVYLETAFQGLRNLIKAQIDFLPALMAYVALSADIVPVTALAVLAGLWYDTMSANPLGVTILPLFLVGLVFQLKQDMILREAPYTQFFVGLAASAAVPVLTLLLILSLGERPLVSVFSLWQWLVMAFGGAIATPFFFKLFDRLEMALNYSPYPALNESMLRRERQIKRGRG